jgi:hypothetical protein
MAVLQKRLAGPSTITTSSEVLYTVPIGVTTIVKQVVMTNRTSSSKTVTVRLKPRGETETSSHDFLSSFSLAAYETISFESSIVLTNNGLTANAANSDQLTAFASANSSVNVIIVGVEES